MPGRQAGGWNDREDTFCFLQGGETEASPVLKPDVWSKPEVQRNRLSGTATRRRSGPQVSTGSRTQTLELTLSLTGFPSASAPFLLITVAVKSHPSRSLDPRTRTSQPTDTSAVRMSPIPKGPRCVLNGAGKHTARHCAETPVCCKHSDLWIPEKGLPDSEFPILASHAIWRS